MERTRSVFALALSLPLCFATLPCAAEVARPDELNGGPTLARVIALARDRAPDVVIQNTNVTVARSALVSARLPGIENPYLELTGERGGAGSTPRTLSASGTLWLPLEVGGQRSARTEAANAGVTLQERLVARARAHAVGGAILAFGRSVVGVARLHVVEDLEAVAKAEAETYHARFTAGDATVQDARFAEVDQARYEVMVEEAKAALASAVSSLELFTGRHFASPPSAPLAPPPIDVRDAADQAPSIAALLSEAAYHGTERRRWEAERVGALSAMLLGGADEMGGARFGVGLAYSFPVFRAYQGERARAEAERNRALVEARVARETVRVQLSGIERERDHLSEAISFIERRAEPVARAAVEAAADMRRLGKGEFLAVLTSRRDLALLRLRHLDLLERKWELAGSLAAITGRAP